MIWQVSLNLTIIALTIEIEQKQGGEPEIMFSYKLKPVELIVRPTPLERLANISRDLNCKEFFIKRDDLTGLAFGGNKGRKLEYLLAEACREKKKVIITEGGIQSNHARMTAAASTMLGMQAALVLSGKKPNTFEGNLLLDYFLGADLVFCDSRDRSECMASVAAKYKSNGYEPYIIPTGGSTPLGTLGYVECAKEIKEQEQAFGIEFDYIVAPVGSGGTHAGLLLGKYLYKLAGKIVAIAADNKDFKPIIIDLAQKAAEYFKAKPTIVASDLIVKDEYVGPGYGLTDTATLEAVKYMARQEGIFLGPVYTGKALAGVLDLLAQGFFKKTDRILFIHTGGGPELFAPDLILNFGRRLESEE